MSRWAALLATFVCFQTEAMAAPRFVYLTWQEDPATAVTVSYHTFAPSQDTEGRGEQDVPPIAVSRVTFDLRSRARTGKPHRLTAAGTAYVMAELADRRRVHRVVLRDLLPDTVYFFVAGDEISGLSAEYSFRTAPGADQPFTFVSGGDMGVGRGARELLAQAAKQSPLFGLVGGDLAYANAVAENYELWDSWLKNWQEEMVTPDNRLVPMVLAVGNHDVDNRSDPPTAPFFFRYFPQGGKSYFSRRVGANLALFVLDSGHLVPHGGAQATWLADQLEASRGVPFRLCGLPRSTLSRLPTVHRDTVPPWTPPLGVAVRPIWPDSGVRKSRSHAQTEQATSRWRGGDGRNTLSGRRLFRADLPHRKGSPPGRSEPALVPGESGHGSPLLARGRRRR